MIARLLLASLLVASTTLADAQTKLQTAGTPQGAVNESSVVGLAGAAGPAVPPPPLTAPLPAPAQLFQPRPALQCADFKRAQGGGWSAVTPMELASPHGPLQITPGQTFTPGDYGPGFDVATVLEHDCPQAPPAG